MNPKRMKLSIGLLALVWGALVLLTASGSAQASPLADTSTPDEIAALPLDHFWCYHTQSAPVNEAVGVQDQFQAQPIQVAVGAPKYFCNPARKKHGDKVFKITNPDGHLIMYEIGQAQQLLLRVEVKNQFGTRTLKVYAPPILLAVPTQKNQHPTPQDLDHFQCYRVKGQASGAQVGLKDQFQSANGLSVGKPVLLCNPTRKLHNGAVYEILHPEAHLVCYRVTPVQFTINVATSNQFRAEGITIQNPDLLCAPSKKRILPPD